MLNTRKCSFLPFFRSSRLQLQQCGLAIALIGDELCDIVLIALELDLPPPLNSTQPSPFPLARPPQRAQVSQGVMYHNFTSCGVVEGDLVRRFRESRGCESELWVAGEGL